MATNNRGGSGGRKRSRGANNNPEGRNQYSGMMGTARSNPVATAAALGGVVAAGAFLWSRRNQISEQIGGLADQISEWRQSDGNFGPEAADLSESSRGTPDSPNTGGERTQVEIAEEALTLKEIGAPA